MSCSVGVAALELLVSLVRGTQILGVCPRDDVALPHDFASDNVLLEVPPPMSSSTLSFARDPVTPATSSLPTNCVATEAATDAGNGTKAPLAAP